MAEAESVRQLRVKTGVVKRTTRELTSYREELAQQRKKIEDIYAAGGVDDKLRQWEQVAEETEAMVPDTANRLSSALEDLRSLVEDAKEAEFPGTATVVAESEKVIENGDATLRAR